MVRYFEVLAVAVVISIILIVTVSAVQDRLTILIEDLSVVLPSATWRAGGFNISDDIHLEYKGCGKLYTDANGNVTCGIDGGAGGGEPSKSASPPYLYNDSSVIYFNETYLNITIDDRSGGSDGNDPRSGAAPYLYNDSTSIYFNDTYGNLTTIYLINLHATGNTSSQIQTIINANPTGNTTTEIQTVINGSQVELEFLFHYDLNKTCYGDDCDYCEYWNGTAFIGESPCTI